MIPAGRADRWSCDDDVTFSRKKPRNDGVSLALYCVQLARVQFRDAPPIRASAAGEQHGGPTMTADVVDDVTNMTNQHSTEAERDGARDIFEEGQIDYVSRAYYQWQSYFQFPHFPCRAIGCHCCCEATAYR